MGWIKLDDGFLDHPKWLRAGPLAGYLGICAIAWSNRNRTDGFVPRSQVRRLVDFEGFGHHIWTSEVVGGGQDVDAIELAMELVACDLWEQIEGGFVIHDYFDWQRSREQIEAGLEQRREAGRRGGEARAASGSLSGSLGVPSSGSLSGVPSEPSSESPSKVLAEGRRKKEEANASSRDESPEIKRLCLLLASLIHEWDPKANLKPTSPTWLGEMRRLVENDGRGAPLVERVIRFCQADEFWRSNILSPGKLRKQFTQLLGRMPAGTNGVSAENRRKAKWLGEAS
jgi:hypothetical protein